MLIPELHVAYSWVRTVDVLECQLRLACSGASAAEANGLRWMLVVVLVRHFSLVCSGVSCGAEANGLRQVPDRAACLGRGGDSHYIPFLTMAWAPAGRGCYAATSRQVQLCDAAPRLHAPLGELFCLWSAFRCKRGPALISPMAGLGGFLRLAVPPG